MKRSHLPLIGILTLAACAYLPAPAVADSSRLPTETHTNGESRQIVNLSTQCLQTNNISEGFFYDRQVNAPFEVPRGNSFVITDINIIPCSVLPTSTGRILAVVTIGGARTFIAGYVGVTTKHYPLSGGLVVPEESSLDGRNTTFSTDRVNIQLLGYFVRGPGLGVGEEFAVHSHRPHQSR